ncbi:hypothetical protein [Methylorubrum zatmanii]
MDAILDAAPPLLSTTSLGYPIGSALGVVGSGLIKVFDNSVLGSSGAICSHCASVSSKRRIQITWGRPPNL